MYDINNRLINPRFFVRCKEEGPFNDYGAFTLDRAFANVILLNFCDYAYRQIICAMICNSEHGRGEHCSQRTDVNR